MLPFNCCTVCFCLLQVKLLCSFFQRVVKGKLGFDFLFMILNFDVYQFVQLYNTQPTNLMRKLKFILP